MSVTYIKSGRKKSLFSNQVFHSDDYVYAFFRFVMTCALVDKCRYFGGIICFRLQVETVGSSLRVVFRNCSCYGRGRLEVNVWSAPATDEVFCPIFLDTFAQSRKAPFKLRHVGPFVSLSVCIIAAPTGRIAVNFDIEDLRKFVEKIQIWLNRAKISGALREERSTFYCIRRH